MKRLLKCDRLNSAAFEIDRNYQIDVNLLKPSRKRRVCFVWMLEQTATFPCTALTDSFLRRIRKIAKSNH
jgi:hypothetical protein